MSPNSSRTTSPQTVEPADSQQTIQVSWKIVDFTLRRQLRNDARHTVYLAREKKSKFICCLKVFKREEQPKRRVELQKELDRLCLLKHPSILRTYGYFPHGRNIVLIEQYSGRENLRENLNKNGPLVEKEAAKLIRQVVHALQYLHSNNIVHGFLSPETIFLGCNKTILLNMFCLDNISSNCLTYRAPETSLDHKADIWSVGVLLFEMICGKTKNELTLGGHKFPSDISLDVMTLLRLTIVRDPSGRSSLSELLKNPWISTANDQEMIDHRPQARDSPIPSNDENEPPRATARSFGTLRSIENLHRV